VKVAETSRWVFVNVMTKSDVPPALIVDGANDFETTGRLGEMGSASEAVHVPEPHPAPVLVTPEGTDIAAVLVTCVCAKVGRCTVRRKKNSNRLLMKAPADLNPNSEIARRLNTFFLHFSKTQPVICDLKISKNT
jgi:hypothetical protein